MGVDKLLLNNEAFFIEVSQMLQSGNSVTLRAKGNSMLPFIMEERDTVVLQKVEAFAVGSVVLACLPGNRYVLHRVYRIKGEHIMLMGDGNLHATECCRREDVAGVVVKIIRDGRVIDITSSSQLFMAALWRKLLPVRRYLLCVCRWWMRRDRRMKKRSYFCLYEDRKVYKVALEYFLWLPDTDNGVCFDRDVAGGGFFVFCVCL